MLQPGDLLVSTANSKALVGKSCTLPELPEEATFGAFVTVLRFNQSLVDREFLPLCLKSPLALNYMYEKSSNTTNISNLKVSELLVLPIHLPPLPEQRRIAAILRDQLDAVRRARKAALARLEAARALPPAFLRSVFESHDATRWPRVKIGEMCTIVATQVSPTLPHYRELPHVSGENIESGTGRLLKTRSAAEDRMISGKYLFETGDVLYSKLRPYLRKVCLAPFKGLCSADMYPLRAAAGVSPPWLAGVLLSEPFSRYADEESKRVRMPKLNRDQLFAWVSPKPDIETQERLSQQMFDGIAGAISTTALVDSELATIDALPQRLLDRAFAGEL